MTIVRPATAEDVARIVDVHRQAFPGFVLTSFGPAFLTRFYAAVVDDKACISLVAENDSSILGFVVGPLQPAGFFRGLFLRQGLGFAIDAVPAIARRPLNTARHLIRGVVYRGDAPEARPDWALLSSIAVVRSATGSGAASALLEAFCVRAAELGSGGVYLTTDRDDNAAANRFYSKHEFSCDGQIERRDGRVMNLYVRALASPASVRTVP
jgi:ribosomal protein S18 acetylase RimI-like enzyme